MRTSIRFLLSMVLVAFALPAVAQTQVRFVHEWRFEGHVSPFLVALDKGYYKDEGLDVTIDPGTGGVDTINKIAAGAYDMGISDINALIKYRDTPGAMAIKGVLMAYDQPPYALITLKKTGITKPKDLEGKILGAPAADAAYQHWPILAKLNDIDVSKVKIENVGFPVRETLLAQGQVDAVTAYSSNSLALKGIGVPDDEIVLMPMTEFGLDLYGSAVVASPDFMQKDPKAVAGFVKATVRGFLDVFADPDGSIASVQKHNPVIKPDVELARLKLVIETSYLTDNVRQNGFGDVDMDRLQSSIEQLALTTTFNNKIMAADVFTSEFLPPKEERMVK